MKKTLENLKYVILIAVKDMPSFFIVMILMILFKALDSLWLVSIPKQIIDAVLSETLYNEIFFKLFRVAFIYLILRILATWTNSRYETKIGLLRTNTFRPLLMRKFMQIKYSALEDAQIRQLVEKAWSSVWSNNWGIEAFLRNMASILCGVLSLGGFIRILGQLNWFLPILLIVSTIWDYYVIHCNEKIRMKYQDESHMYERRIEYINDVMQDPSLGKDIRLFGRGKFFVDRVGMLMDIKKLLLYQQQRDLRLADICQIIITFTRDFFVYFYLGYMVWFKSESVANFTLYSSVSINFSSILMNIISSTQKMLSNLEYVSSIRKIMESEDECDQGFERELLEGFTKTGIIFENVCYRYPNAQVDAVHDFSYKFEPHKCLALVGENGCGKTTIVKLLCGLLTPTSGKILIGNMDVTKVSGWLRYALVGVVFQDINQYAFTLGENVAFNEDYDEDKVYYALAKTELNSEEFCHGLDTVLRKDFDSEGVDLSGGQQQALAIARAFYAERQFIIMDEPTAALDPIAEDKIYQQLAELVKKHSILFISHRLSSTRFCQDIIVMKEGKLVQNGNHNELINTQGYYAELFEAQSTYYNKNIEEA